MRTCFHPGASHLEPNVVKGVEDEVKGRHIVKKMFNYVWPKDKPAIRARVMVALGLLVGSKASTCMDQWAISSKSNFCCYCIMLINVIYHIQKNLS